MNGEEKSAILTLVDFLNENQGAMSILLSLMSLIVAVVAVWISLRSARQQVNMQLFNERYRVFRELIALLSICDMLTSESLTLKGKKVMWNTSGWRPRSEQSEVGQKLILLEEKLSEIEPGTKEYEEVEAERKSLANEKFMLDLEEVREHHEVLIKAKTLFSERISKNILDFLKAYEDVTFHINHSVDVEVVAAFKRLRDTYEQIVSEEVVEKMEKYLDIGRKG